MSQSIDLAKSVFQIHGVDENGRALVCRQLVAVNREADVRISMDGKGRFLDNIFVERLWRSLKYQCLYLQAWSGGSEARRGIGAWIDFYNRRRPHTALARRTPDTVYWQHRTLE